MTYTRKFHRLVEVLGKTHEPELASRASALQVEMATRKKTDKLAYFTLLRECIAVNLKHYDIVSSPPEVRERLTGKHGVGIYLDKISYQQDASPSKESIKLVKPEEKVFVFLWENLEGLRLDKKQKKKFDEIFNQFAANDGKELSIEEVNWQIAQIIFQKLQQTKTNEESLCIKILIGYINKSPSFDKIAAEVQTLTVDMAPLSFSDYLFYRMTDVAFEGAKPGQPGRGGALQKKMQRGPYMDNTLWDELLKLKKRHTDEQPVSLQYPVRIERVEEVPAEEVAHVGAIEQEVQDHLPHSYDVAFNTNSQNLVFELNKHFKRLKHDDEKAKLKQFVQALNTLDASVRELQAKMDLLEDQNRPDDEQKTAYHRNLMTELQEKRKQIGEQATRLRSSAQNLFYQGKESSTWRIILGIGLVIIGTALVAAGIASLVLVPPVVAGLSATALGLKLLTLFGLSATQLNIVSGAALAIGASSLIGSAVSFFHGTKRAPSSIANVVNNTLTVCERGGKDALDRIERYVPAMG